MPLIPLDTWNPPTESRAMNSSWLPVAALALAFSPALPGAAAADPPPTGPATPSIRVYSHLLEPGEHPDFDRRAVRPPDWSTFKHRTQFTCLRGFNVQEDRIVGYVEEIEKFTRRFELGNVIWPSYPILFATNLAELADEIRRRDLYLFDVWGYVPGSGPGGYWQQFRPPASAFATLEARLGDRWLGTDIGEQDGRYVGGYANQMTPSSANRREQYLNFQRHFERMGDDLGHRHATLVSLNFGHYFLKEGTYTLIGAETAQALPNSQVYYAFIRGAGKQYGVPWFGNASIFNRWGFKTYGSSGRSDGYEHGPTKGSSLSLLRRLLYSHILYNSVAVGFENGWFDGDQLSPLGQVQQAANRWVTEHGQPGVLHTPVAVLLDFHSGWSFPRHLYTDKLFRVWGNLPYAEGDHLTDAVLDLLYPGYADASYFHDETGFLTATPYGDIADCLLSDAPGWLLDRYALAIVAGDLAGGSEVRDKLERYVEQGGHLVITEGNLRQLPGAFAARPEPAAPEPVRQLRFGRGQLTLIAGGSGLAAAKAGEAGSGKAGTGAALDLAGFGAGIDKPLPRPFALSAAVGQALDRLLGAQVLFEAGNGLHVIACRKEPGVYTLGVFNHSWRERPFAIASRCGPIRSIRELSLEQAAKAAVGYTPEGIDPAGLGRSTADIIAGGDVRIFAVTVADTNVVEIAHAKPPPRPRGRWLPLRRPVSIKEALLVRPTFFEHFDGVVVDGRYLSEREPAALEVEARWLKRQSVRVVVDASPSVNLYPGLRLIDNLPADYASSLATLRGLLAKLEILGGRDLILSLHRYPENNFTEDQTRAAFTETLKTLAAEAANRHITLYLRLALGKPPWNLEEASRWLDRVGAANLKLAPSVALLAATGADPAAQAALVRDRASLWLVAGYGRDLTGQLFDAHAPLADVPDEQRRVIARWLALAPDLPLILDTPCDTPDSEYREVQALERLRTSDAPQNTARPDP